MYIKTIREVKEIHHKDGLSSSQDKNVCAGNNTRTYILQLRLD